MRNQPIIQVSVGTQQMKDEELADNTMAVLRVLDGKLQAWLEKRKVRFLQDSYG